MSTRTTISLPLALKNRMTKCRSKINWSQIAADAFQAVLDEIEKTNNPQYVGTNDRIKSLEERIAKLEGKK